MARRYDSEAVRNRVLSTSVRLFLERGYHGTTMAAILKEADVSSSSFQNVFGNKDGADEARVFGAVFGSGFSRRAAGT